jgi:hypothetical protein
VSRGRGGALGASACGSSACTSACVCCCTAASAAAWRLIIPSRLPGCRHVSCCAAIRCTLRSWSPCSRFLGLKWAAGVGAGVGAGAGAEGSCVGGSRGWRLWVGRRTGVHWCPVNNAACEARDAVLVSSTHPYLQDSSLHWVPISIAAYALEVEAILLRWGWRVGAGMKVRGWGSGYSYSRRMQHRDRWRDVGASALPPLQAHTSNCPGCHLEVTSHILAGTPVHIHEPKDVSRHCSL